MSFFATRKSAANKNGGSRSTTTTSVTSLAKPKQGPSLNSPSSSRPGAAPGGGLASPPASKLVTVTRKVAPTASTSLKERQALYRAKRERELQLQERAASGKRQKLSPKKDGRGDGDREGRATISSRRSDKGKGRSRDDSHSSDDDDDDEGSLTVTTRAVPRPHKSDATESSESSDSNSSDEDDLGTPFAEKRKPLTVLREDVAAPQDEVVAFKMIHSADLVESNRKAYIPYFPDLLDDLEVHIEYPGDNARERFLLLRPKVKDEQDYQPLQDILNTVRTICDYFLTDEQAREHFKYIRHSSSSALGGFDFLNHPTPSLNTGSPALQTTRDSTPVSETGTPEPGPHLLNGASTAAAAGPPTSINKTQGIMRALEKAYRRKNGKDFKEALAWYNTELRSLRERGLIRENIVALGKEQGIPETVWMGITGQCYERTVGPRIEELKKYEAFSDNTYGELLPPFVAHIAGLVGLKEGSVMVDMGSGVGNCVVQASMATGCKSYGFENQPAAASMASAQVEELKVRARLWGIKYGQCETHEVDFLAAPHLVTPALKAADLVLVNNYVFSPSTNESLSYLFLDLKEGAKVVSLKPFSHASGALQITERNVGNPTSILVQSKPIKFDRGGVSWTAEGGVFYVAEVNRDRVKKWLDQNGQT